MDNSLIDRQQTNRSTMTTNRHHLLKDLMLVRHCRSRSKRSAWTLRQQDAGGIREGLKVAHARLGGLGPCWPIQAERMFRCMLGQEDAGALSFIKLNR